jgi:hypothetical protein
MFPKRKKVCCELFEKYDDDIKNKDPIVNK